MPSGARKRKAAKKKMKNGEAHNNLSSNGSSNSSSTHSHASEDPRSLDERESDSGREEVEAVSYEEGSRTNGKGLSENIAEKAKQERHGSEVVDVAEETPIVILSSEDKEITVEEEKPMVAELEELKALDGNSVLVTNPGAEIPKQVEIAVEAASVELMKDVVSLPQDINGGVGSSVTSNLDEPRLMKDADLALQISYEKAIVSLVSEDLQSERVESKIVSMDEDKSIVTPPAGTSSGLEAVKILESGNATAVTTTQVVECVKGKETLQQSDKQPGFTGVNTSSEVNYVTEISTQKRSMDQTLNGSNPLLVKRTSWMGCCGLFELFSGANR